MFGSLGSGEGLGFGSWEGVPWQGYGGFANRAHVCKELLLVIRSRSAWWQIGLLPEFVESGDETLKT